MAHCSVLFCASQCCTVCCSQLLGRLRGIMNDRRSSKDLVLLYDLDSSKTTVVDSAHQLLGAERALSAPADPGTFGETPPLPPPPDKGCRRL